MSNTRKLQVNEHALVGDILKQAFFDDPVHNWAFGSKEITERLFSTMAKHLYLTKGFGYTTDDQNGTCLWLTPDSDRNVPIYKEIGLASTIIKFGGLKALYRGLTLDYTMKKHRPSIPHYYLFALGTKPDAQGKGIGGKLMREALRHVDEAKMPAYLESSKEENVPIYRHYGFEVIDCIQPTKSSPKMWLMWRDAK